MSQTRKIATVHNVSGASTLEEIIIDFTGDATAAFDLKATAIAYQDAINGALPGDTHLSGSEFYGSGDTTAADIKTAFESIDLTAHLVEN